VLDLLKPKGLKVVGYMCMVRNSIGAHAYTCDEIIKSRSGKRIRIYNTDAEGRITMLDPLTHMREMVRFKVTIHTISNLIRTLSKPHPTLSTPNRTLSKSIRTPF
jgi:leucyl aminopeptidase